MAVAVQAVAPLASWMISNFQLVNLEKFLSLDYMMGIIHLRSAPMGLTELAALPITGLLVTNISFIFYESAH